MSSEGGLPSLSTTYQTTQMLTPRYMERITIDNQHYHGHLSHSLHTHPPHLNMLQRRVQKMGDNYFFVHKDIPEHQSYVRTSLKLSEVRPWDQIVERPLTSDRILRKELHLPFPAEHPYSSHISRFAVFPDTHPTQPALPSLQDSQMPAAQDGRSRTSISVHTQTSVGDDTSHKPLPLAPHPVMPYYVLQKASERGQRVESRHLSMPAGVDMRGSCLTWDFPRSHRHHRSYTYPAPTLQFAPHTPTILPHPSHLPFSPSHTPFTPHTQEALHSIYKTLSRTTTYANQFPGNSHVVQNILQLEHSHRQSHRPWTGESRGKYSMRTTSGTAHVNKSGTKVPNDRYVMEAMKNGHGKSCDSETENDIQSEMKEDAAKEDKSEKRKVVLSSAGVDDDGQVSKVDKATQTDLQFSTTLSFQETTLPASHTLPHLTPVTPSLSTPHPSQPYTPHKLPQLPTTCSDLSTSNYTSQRPHTAQDQTYTPIQPKSVDCRPHTADTYTPRSAVSTRRLMGLYNNFSKTEVLRRFHDQYPEGVPDLRDYSIREGKRHVIHGHHSYYFH